MPIFCQVNLTDIEERSPELIFLNGEENISKEKGKWIAKFKIQTSLKSSLLYRYYFKMVARAVFDNAPIFNSQFSSNLYFYFGIRIEKFLLHEKKALEIPI